MASQDATAAALGYAAGALTTACVVPQLVRCHRTRSAADLSYAHLGALCAGLGLWLAYGALIRQVPVVVPNALALALNLYLLALKAALGRRRPSAVDRDGLHRPEHAGAGVLHAEVHVAG